eukprot:TRINITY_DN96908_c0_g1_i1.p1 TRINITY_DN96908_c0_g1~~TRINITY_DN96908_c0_g1_i1.p1  ORF type:complete len:168 (+),score=17.51 TRINITY_DN96908_c0_g1_i1:119-622(+)
MAPSPKECGSSSSLQSYVYLALKLLLTTQLFPGSLLFANVHPEFDSASIMDPGREDRFVRACRLFNQSVAGFPINLEANPLKIFTGLCKILGVIGVWTDSYFGMEQIATFCFCTMFAMAAVEHWVTDSPDLAPPTVMFVVALGKLLSRPGNTGSGAKKEVVGSRKKQ